MKLRPTSQIVSQNIPVHPESLGESRNKSALLFLHNVARAGQWNPLHCDAFFAQMIVQRVLDSEFCVPAVEVIQESSFQTALSADQRRYALRKIRGAPSTLENPNRSLFATAQNWFDQRLYMLCRQPDEIRIEKTDMSLWHSRKPRSIALALPAFV